MPWMHIPSTYLLKSTDEGNTWSEPVLIDTNYNVPIVNITSNNLIVKTFEDEGNIYVQSSYDGVNWSDKVKINSSNGTASAVSARLFNNQKILAAWIDNRTGGNEIFYGYVDIPLPTSVDDKVLSLSTFALKQNFPNPYNDMTTIFYSLDKKLFVELNVYDMLGKKIKTLVNDWQDAGTYQVKFNSKDLTSGIYLYTLKSGTFLQSKKMILLK